jgi:anti-sigma B factor antagonist
LSLEIRAVQKGSRALVKVSGVVDFHSLPQLQAQVIGMVTGRQASLMIDLEQVEFMDSAGVAALIAALRWIQRQGGRMVLFGVREQVRQVLTLARTDGIFQIHPDYESAMDTLSKVHPCKGL